MSQDAQIGTKCLETVTFAPVVHEHLRKNLSWFERQRFIKRFDKIQRSIGKGLRPGFLRDETKFIRLSDPVSNEIIRLYRDGGFYLFFREQLSGLRLEAVDVQSDPKLAYMISSKKFLDRFFRWKRIGTQVDILLSKLSTE